MDYTQIIETIETSTETDGTTTLHYQPTTNDTEILRQSYLSTIPQKVEEYVITDNVQSVNNYPFSIQLSGITAVELKLNDTIMTIGSDMIISNKPIFIETSRRVLRIWNITSTPHNVLGTQGNTYVDGYDILNFNNSSIKCSHNFTYSSWNVSTLGPLGKLTLNGNNNELCIDKTINEDLSIKVLGNNYIQVKHSNYENLNINSSDSNFDFDNAHCKRLVVDIKGNGKINNLCVDEFADITLVGSQTLNLRRKLNAVCQKMINGPAQIKWLIIN
jgi:hypothetical protein